MNNQLENFNNYENMADPETVQDNTKILYIGAGVMTGLLLALMFRKV